jgi:hypothetical protein
MVKGLVARQPTVPIAAKSGRTKEAIALRYRSRHSHEPSPCVRTFHSPDPPSRTHPDLSAVPLYLRCSSVESNTETPSAIETADVIEPVAPTLRPTGVPMAAVKHVRKDPLQPVHGRLPDGANRSNPNRSANCISMLEIIDPRMLLEWNMRTPTTTACCRAAPAIRRISVSPSLCRTQRIRKALLCRISITACRRPCDSSVAIPVFISDISATSRPIRSTTRLGQKLRGQSIGRWYRPIPSHHSGRCLRSVRGQTA